MPRLLLALLAGALFACPRPVATSADGGEVAPEGAIRLGVDRALEPVKIAEFIRASFENEAGKPVVIRYDLSAPLAERAAQGEFDLVLVASELALDRLDREGIAVRVATWAHEELVYIGPADDPMRSHGSPSAVEMFKNLLRSNARVMRAVKGSAERDRLTEIQRKSGDQESDTLMDTELEGVELVKKVIELRSFGLVRRSAVVVAAAEGIRPWRVYQDGQPDLVLRIRAVEIHPARTKRPRDSALFDFLVGPQGRAIAETYGRERYGLPLFAPGDPPEGEGARAPGAKTSTRAR